MRKTCLRAVLTALTFVLVQTSAQAEGDKDPWKKYADLGAGVYKVNHNKDGSLKSLIVVGQADISNVLGKAKGKLRARQKATQNAKATFMKWMKEKAVIVEISDSESVITTVNEGKGLIQKGKEVEKSSTKYASVANAALSGLITLGSDQGTDGVYTVILAWKPSLSKDAASVKKAMDYDEDGAGEKSGSAKGSSEKGNFNPDNQKFEKKTVISDEADEFLK